MRCDRTMRATCALAPAAVPPPPLQRRDATSSPVPKRASKKTHRCRMPDTPRPRVRRLDVRMAMASPSSAHTTVPENPRRRPRRTAPPSPDVPPNARQTAISMLMPPGSTPAAFRRICQPSVHLVASRSEHHTLRPQRFEFQGPAQGPPAPPHNADVAGLLACRNVRADHWRAIHWRADGWLETGGALRKLARLSAEVNRSGPPT